ncbi:MAG: UDP-glucose/GDP-mannose dehydrogenase family protein [Dehalococcoidia bacterium]|nr:UDP-glucose/GDP-mannose dehydrogenase family protein [Dehalococcoidia bacterium]
MKKICVIGMGYVGMTTAACFSDLGNTVVGLDINIEKLEKLSRGQIPIYEPGLEELIRRNKQSGRLTFTDNYDEGVGSADFVFVAVDSPSGPEGEADMTAVRSAAASIAHALRSYKVIINKSTVPIGTGDLVTSIIERENPQAHFSVVSNPEFLREGSAIQDFMHPDRVVLGAVDRSAAEKVAELYAPLNSKVIITDLRSAEMIKYASNAFLATKISFINEIAGVCEKLGADIKEVVRGMGTDRRIGSYFLDAGIGYGGSCFPKDVKALAHMAAVHGCHPQLLRAVMDINQDQRKQVVQRLREALGPLEGKTIGLLGLSFKPDTDDMRGAPSVEIVHLLQHEGARLRAYDPAAAEMAALIVPKVMLCPDPYSVAMGSDALVILTEWNEFKQLDKVRIKQLMRQPVLVDGRNIYEPDEMTSLGFHYFGIGRGNTR